MSGMSSHTILVVDDSDLVRRLMVRTLKGAGFVVLEARSGLEALRRLEAHTGAVDMLITDLSIRVVHGVELYMELRTRQPRLPVIFVTGSSGNGPGHLQRPFMLEELLGRVRYLLEARA
jgi:two-component system cell cycle sensor histidine kinase/response regulator CckA